MTFLSYSYAILFAVVMAARLTVGRRKTEPPFVAILIAASSLLYSWHVPVFFLILMSSALVDYLAGLYLGRGERSEDGAGTVDGGEDRIRRGLVLMMSLSVNLGLLFFFKYTDFAITSSRDLFQRFGFPARWEPLGLVLPMGISFYTFASLSYTIDVYRREIPPVRKFWKFFLFISFFPHLVAGPIVRASMFLPQMDRVRRPRLVFVNQGLFLIIRGFFLKAVCADNIAPVVNKQWMYGYYAEADSASLVLLAVLFACQIFCDFEGYSSIARGTSYLLGYRLPLNFNNPYLAGSFKNFWERWHITLSQWLRDYLYIPLGGNRGSRARTYVNLMIVMLLGGLWHGSSFSFLAWGGLHGAALSVERLLGLHRMEAMRGGVLRKLAWYLVVQATVLVSWVFFRSESFFLALVYLRNVAYCRAGPPSTQLDATVLVFALPIALMHARGFLVEKGFAPAVGPREKAALAGLMLFAVLTCNGVGNAFIYFQF